MPPATTTSPLPEIEGFLAGLAESNVLDAGRARGAWDDYRRERPYSGVAGFADHLVRRELLTPYQAERALAGEAGKLQIGPYVLLERIGSGDVGTDFLAVHRGGRRHFKVKLLPLRSLWRAHQAKQLTNRFRTLPAHPSIIPLAAIDTANGSHYLSWSHAEGETLAEAVRRSGPLQPHVACRIFAEVADGLAVCHTAGIFHGMLSPANILFDGEILDLGLGDILAEESDGESMIDTISTANCAREMLGYCAPETIEDPTVRSAAADVYSLGCVLYEVLAGVPPFLDDCIVDMMIAHRTQMPSRIRALNAAVPEPLDDLVFALLQKPPRGRPGLRELKEALESLAVGLPVDGSSTIPFGALTLGVGRLDILLAPRMTGHKASQTSAETEGLIDFDVPGGRPSAETPPAYSVTPAPVELAPLKPLLSDRGGSVPVLLLPEPVLLRQFALPNPAPKVTAKSDPLPPKKNWAPPPSPVNWVSAAPKSEIRAVRPPVELPPRPDFASVRRRGLPKRLRFWRSASDTVQLSVFGPPEIPTGRRVAFWVYAHSPETFSDVVTLCRALRPNKDLLGAGYLDAFVGRGVDVNLHLALTYAGVANSLEMFTWIGQTIPRSFEVFVPWDSPPGLASGVVTAGIDKTMVGSIPLHFIIPPRKA